MKFLKIPIYETITHQATKNFILIGFISLIQITSNVILGRVLSKNDFGQFSFIINNIIRVWSVLFLFGQISTMIRLFSKKDIQEYQWKKKIASFLLLLIIPITVASILVVNFYHLASVMILIVIIGSFLLICASVISNIMRAQGKFMTAIIIERAHTLIFMLFLLYSYFFVKNITLIHASILKTLSYSLGLPLLIFMFLKYKEGPEPIKKETIMEGFVFWEMSLSLIVLTNIDSFFIVKILDFKEMALYSIIVMIMIVFDFTRDAIQSVYIQKFAKIQNFKSNKLIKAVLLISLMLSVFYIISTNFILQVLFAGKYYASLQLLILFCVYFTLVLLFVIPGCYLMGRGTKPELRKMMMVNIIAIAVKISFIFLFSKYGLSGFLFASILSQGFRTAGGYYISFKTIKKSYI